MRALRALLTDKCGSTTALVAVSLTALVSVMALGIDLGMLFNARSEAQRAADAAALAGASAFLDYPAKEAEEPAVERALEYASQNRIRKEPVETSEVSVSVNVDSATVTVYVRREAVSTWFAKLLSISEVPIGATATAQASDAGTAQCLRPFAVPDAWEETSEDRNGNRIQDPGETWRFDPSSDRYLPYSGPGGDATETGYGGAWRDPFSDTEGRRYTQDYGRRITIKVTDPHATLVPSFFYPWVIPPDPGQPDCGEIRDGSDPGTGDDGKNDKDNNGKGDKDNNGKGDKDNNGKGDKENNGKKKEKEGGNNGNPNKKKDPKGGKKGAVSGGSSGDTGGKGRGADAYRRNICSCNASVIDLENEYLVEPGNMVGPTFQGVQTLIAQDPDAWWDEANERVVSDLGEDSPRIITVALFDPSEMEKGGRQYIRFNNFARFFIERQDSPQDPVVGRFLYYVASTGGGDVGGTRTGSLVKRLRLIR